jgi:DNA-binding NtrC family response regulator
MALKILIVEDQFIEASDLQTILERAGHQVIGIAKSVDQAINQLKKDIPDMVLLDIFLKGALTGIDLAVRLSVRNIPFIYISANSNQSTLEAAKATNPYGFLIKPYREKDILLTLDIASYRFRHTIELIKRQEKWLGDLLEAVLSGSYSREERLLQLINAFKTFIHFDYIVIDMQVKSGSLRSALVFNRIDYNDYQRITETDITGRTGLTSQELEKFRIKLQQQHYPLFSNDEDFLNAVSDNRSADALAKGYGIKSCLLLPVLDDDQPQMFISFFSNSPDSYREGHLDLLSPMVSRLFQILDLSRRGRQEPTALNELAAAGTNKGARPLIAGGVIAGKSPKLLQVLDQVTQVAPFNTTVLVSGETGVGKEGIVTAIHQLSPRHAKPLIKINCAAIPGGLIESELFGHEKGAFTSASEKRIGKFEQAQGGTIFLDEIGEIPIEVQSKLLRVLQEKELERIGGRTTIKIDARIIAATNKNLYKAVSEGKFRIDLYYRLHVFPIIVPPLRDRRVDIPLLVRHFLQLNAQENGKPLKTISADMMKKLEAYHWPGNVRELQHVIERAVVMTKNDVITSVEFPGNMTSAVAEITDKSKFQSIEEIEKAHILAALKECNGKISGKGGAAEILNIPSTTLTSKMKKFGINWRAAYL